MIFVPEGWAILPLGEIADTQLGKMLNTSKQTGDGAIPYLRNINVQWGRVDVSDLKTMDIPENERDKFTAVRGDLLVCEGGETGRAAIWTGSDPVGFQNALHRVRPRSVISNEYLLHYFEWQAKSGLMDHLVTGVTIKHFTQEKLRRLEVLVPPIVEQEAIVELLSKLDAAEALISNVSGRVRTSGMSSKLDTLRMSILHQAFTGKLTRV